MSHARTVSKSRARQCIIFFLPFLLSLAFVFGGRLGPRELARRRRGEGPRLKKREGVCFSFYFSLRLVGVVILIPRQRAVNQAAQDVSVTEAAIPEISLTFFFPSHSHVSHLYDLLRLSLSLFRNFFLFFTVRARGSQGHAARQTSICIQD